jgi:hypothetical protein
MRVKRRKASPFTADQKSTSIGKVIKAFLRKLFLGLLFMAWMNSPLI